MILDIRKQNGRKVSEALFLATFSCYLILQLLSNDTTFIVDVPQGVIGIIRAVLLGIGIYRLSLVKSETPKSTLGLVAILFGLGLFFLIARGDYFVLDMSIVLLGSIKVPFKRIGYLYIFITAFIGVLALICSQIGVIPDYVFYSELGSRTFTRHSLGIIYPTDSFAHLFYLAIVYFIVRWKKISYIELGLWGIIGVILFIFTGARADFVCMLFVVIASLICKALKYKEIKLPSRIKAILGALVMPIGASFMILLTYFFKPYSITYSKIDTMMTQRLSLGRQGFDLYGFSPLGAANFAENGNSNGGVMKYDYVFYDSSYIKTLFKYGYIVLLVVLVIYAFIAIRLVSEKMFYAMVFVIAIAMSCIIEHHIWELSYNLSFLLLTADMSSCLQSDPLIINNNKKML